MFERGEGTEGGERLSEKRAKKVGENVKNAVNAGIDETPQELADGFVSGGDFDDLYSMSADRAAAEKVLGWLEGDERTSSKIREKLEEREAKRKWDNYIGVALAAKEKEVDSMLTPEERAEKVRGIREKVDEKPGFLKVRAEFAVKLATVATAMFLTACGEGETGRNLVTPEEGIEFNTGGEDDEQEEGVNEEEWAERPAGVRPGADDETLGEKNARTLDEILELSKTCNLLDFTPEELAIVGNNPKWLEEFEESEDSRVLENGLQLNYSVYYSPDKKGDNKFGRSVVEIWAMKEGRTEALIDTMMEGNFAQPQELAAQVANLDMVLLAAGVDKDVFALEGSLDRAQAVYEQMLNREDGGELQAKLRGALYLALTNERTSYNFYTENRLEDSFYLFKRDSETTESPETNLVLGLSEIQRHDASQVQIVFRYGDISEYVEEYPEIFGFERFKNVDFTDYKETLDLNGDCYLQPNREKGDKLKQVIEKVVLQTQEEVVTKKTESVSESSSDESRETTEETTEEASESEGEKAKSKNSENKDDVIAGGGQTNTAGVMGNVDDLKDEGILSATNVSGQDQIPQENITGNTTGTYVVTEEPTIGGGKVSGGEAGGASAGNTGNTGDAGNTGNTGSKKDEQVVDGAASKEKQEADKGNQKQVDLEEQVNEMSDEDFAKWLEQYLNGGN